jgi:tRNA (mo5U34)-methyltransferase
MPMMTESFTQDQIRRRVRELGSWFHNLDLGGVQTAPDHFLGDYPEIKWTHLCAAIPRDLTGATVLDIGCNAGFYSIEMKRRGASRVVGIDSDDDYLAQAKFAAEVCGVKLELRRMSVYDVAQLRETFDWVLFMGVFYHLRHPLLALDLLREHVVKDWLVFQTMLRGSQSVLEVKRNYPFSEADIFDRPDFPKMHFIEASYANDPTNWWAPNRACTEAMLRSSGFKIISQPESEIYMCRRDSRGGTA